MPTKPKLTMEVSVVGGSPPYCAVLHCDYHERIGQSPRLKAALRLAVQEWSRKTVDGIKYKKIAITVIDLFYLQTKESLRRKLKKYKIKNLVIELFDAAYTNVWAADDDLLREEP